MRTKLHDRRPSETRSISFSFENGREQSIMITIGFNDEGAPKEVFCADFKAGTMLHAIVMDACILFSRLLQHGDLPPELHASMCQPPSLIGTIAAAVAECTGPQISRGGQVPVDQPIGPVAPVAGGAVVEAS
jgi:hypothetical protein